MRALLLAVKQDDLAGILEFTNLDVDAVLPERGFPLSPILEKSAPLIAAAAFYGSYHVFRFLLDNGACLTFRDRVGRTLPIFASAGGCTEIMNIIDGLGFDWHAQDVDGNTCVHYATMFHKKQAVYWLYCHAGLDVTALNKQRLSPLHIAANNGEAGLIRFFVENGCDVNQRSERGVTPLHLAASKTSVAAVNKLIKRGADTTIRDNNGCMPHQWAAFRHIHELILASAPL